MSAFAVALGAFAAATAVPSYAQSAPSPAATTLPKPATAPTPSSPPASPSPSPTPRYSYSGYVDASYTGDFGNSSLKFVSLAQPGVNTPTRAFDYLRNRAVVNTVNFAVTKASQGEVGGHLEFNFGNDANTTTPYPWIADGQIYGNKGADITQAFLSYTNIAGNLTVSGGRMPTLVGAEVIRSPDNYNISRSMLFTFAEPLTHTGLRGNYAVNHNVNFTLGVNLGADMVVDTNKQKSLESQLAYSNANYSIAASYLAGVEQATGKFKPVDRVNAGTRQLFDVVATIHATDKVTAVLNYDLGTQGNAYSFDSAGNPAGFLGSGLGGVSWSGLAGYVNFQATPKFAVTFRGEYYNDNNGYTTGLAQSLTSGALTGQYNMSPFTIVRLEYRADNSNQPAYLPTNCLFAVGCNPFKFQNTIGAELIQKF